MKNSFKKELFVIGLDGGGTKTIAVLSDGNGNILGKGRSGSSNPRNIGIEEAVENIVKAIKESAVKVGIKNISIIFLGLPCVEEEFKEKKDKIKKEILKNSFFSSFTGKIVIESDQLVGFRAVTNEKNGILLNAGTGAVIHGWTGKKEVKIDGWGYLSEEGSAFWVGQEALRYIFKQIDGREKETLLKNLIFKKLKIKKKEELIEKIYSKGFHEKICSLSVFVAEAGEKKDKIAKEILKEAAKKLSFSAIVAIKKLDFQKKEFPLVLSGSMFNSKIILNFVKEEIKKIANRVVFIRNKKEPVLGAVILALEILFSESFDN